METFIPIFESSSSEIILSKIQKKNGNLFLKVYVISKIIRLLLIINILKYVPEKTHMIHS